MIRVPEGRFSSVARLEKTRVCPFPHRSQPGHDGAFNRYLLANGKGHRGRPRMDRMGDQPGRRRSWDEATQYAAWAKKRLPTERMGKRTRRIREAGLGVMSFERSGCDPSWRDSPHLRAARRRGPRRSYFGLEDLCLIWEWTSDAAEKAGRPYRARRPWRDRIEPPTAPQSELRAPLRL